MAPIRTSLTWEYRGWAEGAPHPTWRLTRPDGSFAEIEERQDNGRPWTRSYRISFNGGIHEGNYATRAIAESVIARRLGIAEVN